MTTCDRCKRDDSPKVDILKVCLDIDDSGDVTAIVPDMELCKTCRADLRMTVRAWLEKGKVR